MPRLLISNNHLRRHAGSEMVTLEIVEEFVRRGWQVDVSTNLFMPPFANEFTELIAAGAVRVPTDPYAEFGLDYDLIWIHHNLLPPSTIELMAASEFSVPIVWHHMSPIAHIEFPLLAAVENEIADRMTFMSPATQDSLLDFGLDPARAMVLPNPVPFSFTSHPQIKTSTTLRSLAVVSNHVPEEVYEAARLLRQENVVVEFIGGNTPRRMDPQVLEEFDAVLTIGKTVQYALSLGIPAYIYDHFGGDGWLLDTNFDGMSYTNFSGRNSHRKISGEELAAELRTGYSASREFSISNLEKHRARFSLPNYIDSLLTEEWVQNPRPKRLSEGQKLQWLGFAEQFRGLYRELEYFKDRNTELLVSAGTHSSALGVTRQVALERLTTKPLGPSKVAIVVDLEADTMQRSLLSIRTQTATPSELHLIGPPDVVAQAMTSLSEWAMLEEIALKIVPDGSATSMAAAVNHVAQNTACGIITALDAHTSWLHTFIESSLTAFGSRPEIAAMLHRSIVAFVDRDARAVQYYFGFGPEHSYAHDLLADDLLDLKAAPLSNMLIRTQQLLDAGGFDSTLSDNGSHTLLLRLSRLGPVVVAAGHEHSEVVHFRLASTREAADQDRLVGENYFHQRELLDTLLKSPDPRDNSYATLLDRRRSQASFDEVSQFKNEANHRLDLLLERVPSQGFEARMRMWAGQFPSRAKRAVGRRVRALTNQTSKTARTSEAPHQQSGHRSPHELIANADIVSFDVFDTLLDRPVLRPSDAFALAAEAVRRKHGRWISPEWPEQRVAAEIHCYGKPGIGPDITIEDIYAELEARRVADAETLSLLQQAELDVELELLAATVRGKELFEEAKRSGKTILIVSDMYLPKRLISDALTAAGYAGWEQLIVSGYDKIGKHSGTAFARLAQDYPGKTIAHFGDNLEADVIQPRHYGATSSLLERPRDLAPSQTGGTDVALLRKDSVRTGFSALDLARSFSGGMAERRLDRVPTRDPLADIGYSVLGPALVGLSQWLDAQARRNGTEKLLFLAREGRLMMQAYQTLWGDAGLESHYAYASRRMINLTQVTSHLTESALDFLTATGTPLSVADYVRRFIPELPESSLRAALEGTHLEPTTVLGPERSAEIRAVFRRLEDEVIDVIQGERVNVLDYLRSIGADRSNAGVVDIGWQGSIQRSIEQALNPDLLGYYFALHDVPSTRSRTSLNGFIDPRDDHAVSSWHQNQLMPGIEVVELLFANPEEASVSGVRKVDDGYAPVYSKEKLGPAEAARIRVLQAAALEFVRDFAALDGRLSSGAPRLTPEAALAPLSSLITDPTPIQAQTIGSFPHDNSLGIIATPLGLPAHSSDFYRRNPEELQREFDSAWWKPGFRANARTAGITI